MLCLKLLMCCGQVSLLSKVRPKNLIPLLTVSGALNSLSVIFLQIARLETVNKQTWFGFLLGFSLIFDMLHQMYSESMYVSGL